MNTASPRITVVTPSYNQASFLERTLKSVLDQGYPNLEHIVIDGGSTDGSVEIIKQYASRLAYWVSEPDRGQAHAINKGLQRATGEWVAWQNSDDLYLPGCFERVAAAARKHPKASLIIGDMQLIDADDRVLREQRYVRPTYGALVAEGMVLTNQAAFWRRDLHMRIGWLDESLHYGFDYEWFLRLLQYDGHAVHIPKILGALRYHADTKTSQHGQRFTEEYRAIRAGREATTAWRRRWYQARRLALTLANGHFSYVARGCLRRLRSD